MSKKGFPLPDVSVCAIATVLLLAFCSASHGQRTDLNRLIGEWEISTESEPNDKRVVVFELRDGRLTGIYKNVDGVKLRITGIAYSNGAYSFRVPKAELVFSHLRFNGEALRGEKVVVSSREVHIVPQVVQMLRKSRKQPPGRYTLP
jgi:hypothetical protein